MPLARLPKSIYPAAPTMTDAKKTLPIDPKDLVTTAIGFVVGLGILVFFIGLAKVLDLTLLVNHGNIPHQ